MGDTLLIYTCLLISNLSSIQNFYFFSLCHQKDSHFASSHKDVMYKMFMNTVYIRDTKSVRKGGGVLVRLMNINTVIISCIWQESYNNVIMINILHVECLPIKVIKCCEDFSVILICLTDHICASPGELNKVFRATSTTFS